MKFDFCIGNPPYQEEKLGDNEGYAPPVYNKFLDAAFEIADKVEMIHPARFLFNGGATPKAWNEKMLKDPQFKVLQYEEEASKIFPSTEIKGGIAITYRDINKDFGAIRIFTKFPVLNHIVQKVTTLMDCSIADIVYTQNRFNLENVYGDYPEIKKIIGSNGKDKRFRNNIFTKVNLFRDKKINIDDIATIGVIKNKRINKFINKKYVDFEHPNIKKYKALVARANGSGKYGDTMSSPFTLKPDEAYTQTFIGIGSFDFEIEADNTIKYIKSKFARAMLGVLKITQDNDREVWRLVPTQDFTSNSDIDWTKSIPEIDQQLYKKYGLSQEEIDFIESHVKEMA